MRSRGDAAFFENQEKAEGKTEEKQEVPTDNVEKETEAEEFDETTKEEEVKETKDKNSGHGMWCRVSLDWLLLGKITLLSALVAAGFVIAKQMRK